MFIPRNAHISVDVLQLEFFLSRSNLIFSEKACVKLKHRQNICQLTETLS